ncbi:hypothetical protein PHET_04645, partial [Paragonimus heterotremus]
PTYSRPHADEKLSKTLQIVVFINGNENFPGRILNIDCEKCRDIGDLFAKLTYFFPKSVYPSFGIRRIFTPKGRHRITSMKELRDGLSYVCAGPEAFKNLNYGASGKSLSRNVDTGRHLLHSVYSNIPPTGFRPIPNEILTTDSKQPSQQYKWPSGVQDRMCAQSKWPDGKPNLVAVQTRPLGIQAGKLCEQIQSPLISNPLTVLSNTLQLVPPGGRTTGTRNLVVARPNLHGEGLTALKVVLAKSCVQTLGQVLCEISIAFGARWTNDPLRHLYSIIGREVRSVSELLDKRHRIFIGSGIQPIFGRITDHGYDELREAETRLPPINASPVSGVDIRAMLTTFWPKHPDPSSVVYQWEQRNARNGLVQKRVQEENTKHNGRLPRIPQKPLPAVVTQNVTCTKQDKTAEMTAFSKDPPNHVAGDGQRDSGFEDATTPASSSPKSVNTGTSEPAVGNPEEAIISCPEQGNLTVTHKQQQDNPTVHQSFDRNITSKINSLNRYPAGERSRLATRWHSKGDGPKLLLPAISGYHTVIRGPRVLLVDSSRKNQLSHLRSELNAESETTTKPGDRTVTKRCRLPDIHTYVEVNKRLLNYRLSQRPVQLTVSSFCLHELSQISCNHSI